MEVTSSRGLVLHEFKPAPPLKPNPVPLKPFRLLDLPTELKRLVFACYYGEWAVVLDYVRFSMFRTKFRVFGVPSSDLLLVSRAVYRLASEVRYTCFTGRLTLNNVFILIPLRKKADFGWLKHNVRTLHFSDSSVNPERWSTYFTGFNKLTTLEIDFPAIVRLDSSCLDLDLIMGKQNIEPLVTNLQYLRGGLVAKLPSNVKVVVGQRYCLKNSLILFGWKGIIHAKISLGVSSVDILDLTYDRDTTIMSKREFVQSREL